MSALPPKADMCGATRYPLCANSGHALSGSGPIARATGPLMQGRLLLSVSQLRHDQRDAFTGRHSHRGLQMRNLMWEFLVALVFLVGTFLLLGGELFFGHLFSVPSILIGIGAVLCVLATIAKERIDRAMTAP